MAFVRILMSIKVIGCLFKLISRHKPFVKYNLMHVNQTEVEIDRM